MIDAVRCISPCVFSLTLPFPFYVSLIVLFTKCIFLYNRNATCTSNGQEKTTYTAAHVGRNGETSGVSVEAEDIDNMPMRKRQKVETVEKKLERITVSSNETSKVTSLSSLSTVVKAEADKHLQRHETKQVKSNRDWRHLRPPGH